MDSNLDTLFYGENPYDVDLVAACSLPVEIESDKPRLHCGG